MSGKKSILVFRDRPIYSNGLICLIHNVYSKIFFIIVGAHAPSYPSYNIRKDLVIFLDFYVWKETSHTMSKLELINKKVSKISDHLEFFFMHWTNLSRKNWNDLASPFWGLIYITLNHYIEIGRFGQTLHYLKKDSPKNSILWI